ncbi:MAG: TadE/TadG family type IV pilus assembly protein [Pirellulales bacterium]
MIHRFGARSHRKDRRGTAAVEFAVMAPFLILLVFGMLEVGRALMVQHLLTNAVRDGARSATLESATAGEVEAQVASYLAASSVPGATVTVDPMDLTTAAPGDPVTVTASVPFDTVNWLPSSFFLEGATLDATMVMRRETSTSTYTEP